MIVQNSHLWNWFFACSFHLICAQFFNEKALWTTYEQYNIKKYTEQLWLTFSLCTSWHGWKRKGSKVASLHSAVWVIFCSKAALTYFRVSEILTLTSHGCVIMPCPTWAGRQTFLIAEPAFHIFRNYCQERRWKLRGLGILFAISLASKRQGVAWGIVTESMVTWLCHFVLWC